MRAFTKYDFHSAWKSLCMHDNILDTLRNRICNKTNINKTGPTALIHALGHRASANVGPCGHNRFVGI